MTGLQRVRSHKVFIHVEYIKFPSLIATHANLHMNVMRWFRKSVASLSHTSEIGGIIIC